MYRGSMRASQLLAQYKTLEPNDTPRESWCSEPEKPAPLPRNLEVALLTLWHSDHAQQVLNALLGAGTARANRDDYAALVPLGSAIRDRHGYHAITPIGLYRARLLTQALAAELGIRLVSYRSPVRSGHRRTPLMSDYGNA